MFITLAPSSAAFIQAQDILAQPAPAHPFAILKLLVLIDFAVPETPFPFPPIAPAHPATPVPCWDSSKTTVGIPFCAIPPSSPLVPKTAL